LPAVLSITERMREMKMARISEKPIQVTAALRRRGSVLMTALAALFVAVTFAPAQTPDTRWYAARPKAKSYAISTADELAGLAAIVNGTASGVARDNFAGKTVKLAGGIDISIYDNWTPIGRWDPAANTSVPFSGTFDGGGHVISGLTINRPDAQDQGLFGYVERGQVKNLGLEGVNISARTAAGAVAGIVWLKSGVTNCYTTGVVTAAVSHAGGIAGTLVDSSYITRSYSAAEVRSGDHAGGIAGRIGGNSSITYCAALNPVVAATDSDPMAGRIAGSIADSRLGPVTLANNAAYDGMKDDDGSAAWPKKGADKQNGADITAAEIAADGSIGGRFKGGKSGWTSVRGKLPGLGGRTVETPGHLR